MRNYKKKKNKEIEMNNSLFWVRKEENTAEANELREITSSGIIRVSDTVMQVERGLRALMDRTMTAFKMLLCHMTLRIFTQYLCYPFKCNFVKQNCRYVAALYCPPILAWIRTTFHKKKKKESELN